MVQQHHGTVATPNVLEHNGIGCMQIKACLEHADQIFVQVDAEQILGHFCVLVQVFLRLMPEEASIKEPTGAESVIDQPPDAFVQALLIFSSQAKTLDQRLSDKRRQVSLSQSI